MEIYNPANDRHLITLEEDTKESIQKKFDRAKAALTSWSQTPIETRIEAIQKFKALVEQEKPTLAEILTNETGKPITQSKNELNGLIGRIDFFLNEAANILKEEVVSEKGAAIEEKITKEPLGVIANISAWNYPYFVGSNVFIPALLTGNTVLYKPSEYAT